MTQPQLGVLALQGAFREHRQRLETLGAAVKEVRLPADLHGLSGLILPGGESTTMARLMTDYALWQPVRDFYTRGGAIWGTCAGAILLARDITGAPPQFGKQDSLGLMDIRIRRNAFGRQVDSFTTPLNVVGLEQPFPAVFIRAPVIESVGTGVDILAEQDGQVVLARQGRLLASSFHPELTPDPRLHDLFLQLISELAIASP